MFTNETIIFWLIHLFIGVILPLLIYWACCEQTEPQPAEANNTVRH